MANTPDFSPKEFARHLEIISNPDPVFLYKSWVASAIYFTNAAENQVDLSKATTALLEIYRDSNNITVMEHAANALVCHYQHQEDFSALIHAMKEASYPSYYLRSIEHYHKNQGLPADLLDAVCNFALDKKYLCQDILSQHILFQQKDQNYRLETVLNLLEKKFAGTRVLSQMMREFSSRGITFEAHLGPLTKQLKNKKLQGNCINDMMSIMEAGTDFSSILTELKSCLDEKKIAFQIAYCLAYQLGRQKDYEGANFLLEHKSAAIRRGALRGLFYNQPNNAIVLEKNHLALLDPHEAVQQMALQLLNSNRGSSINTQPSPAVLQVLIDHLATAKREVVIPYLSQYIQEDPAFGKLVLSYLDHPKNKQIRLKEICETAIQGNYTAPCSICISLPRKHSYSETEPQVLEQLVPKVTNHKACKPIVRQCPECSNLYLYEVEFEDWDIRYYVNIHLQRLLTIEALPHLKGKKLVAYEKQLPQLVQKLEQELNHTVPHFKLDAAHGLTAYYYTQKKDAELCRILAHEDVSILLTVLNYLFEQKTYKTFIINPSVIRAIQQCIQFKGKDDSAKKVRKTAMTLYTFYTLVQPHPDSILSYFRHKRPEVRTGLHHGLYLLSLHTKIDLIPFQEHLIFAASKDRSWTNYAKYILDDMIKKHTKGFDTQQYILFQLNHRSHRSKEEGLVSLKYYLKQSKKYRWSIDLAGPLLLVPKLAYYALEVLKLAAVDKATSTLLLPHLERALVQNKKAQINEMLYLYQNIYESGVDVQHFLPQIGRLLHLNRQKHKAEALGVLKIALKKDIDLSFLLADLKKAFKGNSDSYDEQITYTLMNIYLRNNNLEAIRTLLLSKNRTQRHAALHYLEYDYPHKKTLDITGFMDCIIFSLDYQLDYVANMAKSLVNYYKKRSKKDRIFIEGLLK